jgi:hypothetical protein
MAIYYHLPLTEEDLARKARHRRALFQAIWMFKIDEMEKHLCTY